VLKSYESSPGKRRYFCGHCGSRLIVQRDGSMRSLFESPRSTTIPALCLQPATSTTTLPVAAAFSISW
jgi:hypothetical protein